LLNSRLRARGSVHWQRVQAGSSCRRSGGCRFGQSTSTRIPTWFHINLLPTFIVILDAAEIARLVGPHTRRELAAALRRALSPGVVRVHEPPAARGLWNDFTTRLWAFSSM
jgi:hypothetical protein